VRKVNHGMSSRKGGAQADALCAGSNLPKDRIDFPSYLQFRLANDFRKTEQGIRYFWNLLDTKHEGFITQFTINYFLREVLSSPFFGGQYEMQDVKDEIFDMLRPADPLKITLADLLSAGVADTVVGIMTDYNGFYLYDQVSASVFI
jgi:serine/threonine-protein phosphatase 2A regulatory subunit B''